MPMTVIRVSGRVRHIRPLPSDSTTITVPVSATAKFAPETATFARRNFSRRWSRAASASAARLVGQVGRGGASDRAISRSKMSRISRRLRWIAGTRMCDGRSCPSWTMSSARSVSQAAMPSRCERLVELDLLGGHRLDLDDLVGARVAHDPRHDRVRLRRVARPVDRAAGRGHVALQLVEQLGQVGDHLVLDRRAGQAQRLPVGALGDGAGPLGPDRPRRRRQVRPQLVVGERGAGGVRERRRPGEGRGGGHAGEDRSTGPVTPAPPTRGSPRGA